MLIKEANQQISAWIGREYVAAEGQKHSEKENAIGQHEEETPAVHKIRIWQLTPAVLSI